MEQKHKPSSSKFSASMSRELENEAMSTSKGEITQEETVEGTPPNPSLPPHHKSKGFRGILKLLPFSSGNKNKSQSSKKRNNPVDTPFDGDDIRRLIGLYSKYENLYNTKNPQYGNKQIDTIYYSDMARSFPNKTGPQIQATLEDLREAFEQEYAVIENARASNGEIRIPSIKYYNEFLFLVPFLNVDTSDEDGVPGENGTTLTRTSSTIKKPLSAKDLGPKGVETIKNKCISAIPGNPVAGCGPCGRRNKKKKGSDDEEEPPPKDGEVDPTLQKNENPGQAAEGKQGTENASPDDENPDQCQADCAIRNQQYKSVAVVNGPIPANGDPRASNNGQSARFNEYYSSGPPSNRASQGSAQVASGARTSVGSRNAVAEQRGGPRCQDNCRGNGQQLQMLCDMIRAELGSAPDFIYFDAKWRIIEILREVNKRQMIYKKGDPGQSSGRNSEERNSDFNTNNNNVNNNINNQQRGPGSRKVCTGCAFCSNRPAR